MIVNFGDLKYNPMKMFEEKERTIIDFEKMKLLPITTGKIKGEIIILDGIKNGVSNKHHRPYRYVEKVIELREDKKDEYRPRTERVVEGSPVKGGVPILFGEPIPLPENNEKLKKLIVIADINYQINLEYEERRAEEERKEKERQKRIEEVAPKIEIINLYRRMRLTLPENQKRFESELEAITHFLPDCQLIFRHGEYGIFKYQNFFFICEQDYASCDSCQGWKATVGEQYDWAWNELKNVVCFKDKDFMLEVIRSRGENFPYKIPSLPGCWDEMEEEIIKAIEKAVKAQ